MTSVGQIRNHFPSGHVVEVANAETGSHQQVCRITAKLMESGFLAYKNVVE